MKLLSVERIKLFSTRSPYWCLVSIFAGGVLFALLISLVPFQGEQLASTGTSQAGMQLGMVIFMVLAALSVTTEYRFGTVRNTFLAAPRRVAVLGAKTVLIVLLGAVAALVTSFAAFALVRLFANDPAKLALDTADQWRLVLGSAAVYAVAGVIALSIGTLVRQSAGAIALLLVWAIMLENLLSLIPWVREHNLSLWMPFNAGGAFTTDDSTLDAVAGGAPGGRDLVGSIGPGPWEGLAVFAGTALVLWLVAALVINRRDA